MVVNSQWVVIFSNGFALSQTVVVSWIIMIALIVISFCLTRNLKVVPTSKVQVALEFGVITLKNLVEENMGKDVSKKMPNIIPYVGSLFLFMLFSNLIPLLGFRSPTADVDTTLAWSLITVFLMYFEGMKKHGLAYWKGLLEPLPLLLPLNIIGEIARPISLTFRPFGNILGGTIIMALFYQFLGFVSTLIPNVTIPFLQFLIPVPFHFYFDIFAGTLQAFIFLMLTIVFISSAAE